MYYVVYYECIDIYTTNFLYKIKEEYNKYVVDIYVQHHMYSIHRKNNVFCVISSVKVVEHLKVVLLLQILCRIVSSKRNRGSKLGGTSPCFSGSTHSSFSFMAIVCVSAKSLLASLIRLCKFNWYFITIYNGSFRLTPYYLPEIL